jgi:hypothetical protein
MTTVWVGDVDHLRPGRFYFYFQNASTFASLHVIVRVASSRLSCLSAGWLEALPGGHPAKYSEVGQICHQKSPFVITGVIRCGDFLPGRERAVFVCFRYFQNSDIKPR